MLNRTRKPLHRKYRLPKSHNSDEVLQFDALGFFKEAIEEQYDDIIEENQIRAAIMQPNKIVSTLLRDLGLTRPNDMFLFDMCDIRRVTVEIGRRVEAESRQEILSMLDMSDLLDFQEFHGDYVISGFMKDIENNSWINGACDPVATGPIQVVGHSQEEGLFCPSCLHEFMDINSILLGQTVSINPYSSAPTTHVDDIIKVIKPHIVLTPICPNCYCETAQDAMADRSQRHLGPVFLGCDDNKNIVPLLPLCFKPTVSKKNNALHYITRLFYWPNTDADVLCRTKLKDIVNIQKGMQSQEKNTDGDDNDS